jgi:propanol-preferring alcohol dehydrogenase
MFAQVLHQWGGVLSYEEVPTPSPAPGEALVKVEACGVGLTVLNYMRGDLRQPTPSLPRIPGHEIVGRVEALGEGATGLHPGDRVMAYFYLTCGQCEFCRLAHEPLCRDFRGYVGVNRDGGYAEYVTLPAVNWLPVPKGLSAVEATAIPDAIATPYHVCRRASIGPGDVVVVVGAGGGVGIHTVQMVRAFGGEAVGVDLGEAKLQAIRTAGAVAAVDFRTTDRLERIRAVAPAGVTVAVDFVGRPETLTFCLEALDRRGRLVLLTTFPGVEFPVSPRAMVINELTIMGSRYASRWELLQAARLVAQGKIRPVVSETVSLEKVETIHEKLREGTLLGRGAIAF